MTWVLKFKDGGYHRYYDDLETLVNDEMKLLEDEK